MATLVVQDMKIAGLEATYAAAAAGGDAFANDGKTFLHVKNGGAGNITVTITSQFANPPAGTAQSNQAVVVTLAKEKMIGPFSQRGFNNASGQVAVTYSGVTTVTVAAIKLVE